MQLSFIFLVFNAFQSELKLINATNFEPPPPQKKKIIAYLNYRIYREYIAESKSYFNP